MSFIALIWAAACSDDAPGGANNQPDGDAALLDAAGGDAKSGADADASALIDVPEPEDAPELEDIAEPEDGSGAADGAGEDTVDAADAGPTGDAGDAGEDGASPDGNGEEVSEDDAGGRDTIEEDADADAVADPYQGRPLGQCTESSECPDGPMGAGMCSRALPGGACMGCGTDAHCPSGATCVASTCRTECDSNDDCAPGLRCVRSLGSKFCAAISCVDGQCPVALFTCGSLDQCERVDCSGDPSVCPSQTTCISGRCIEDRAR